MGQCKHHPQSSTEGVCSSCLQKKLKSVRWGETGPSPLVAENFNSGITIAKQKVIIDPVHPKEAIAILGSIASIKNRNQRGVKPARDITKSGLDFVLDSRYPDQPGFSSKLIPMSPSMCPASKTAKDRKRWTLTAGKSKPGKSLALADSKPLVDSLAKETALRVIREVTDEISVEGDGGDRNAKEGKGNNNAFFSPSHLLSKWGLKGIVGSPMVASSNKVFPSKQSVQISPARDQSRVHIVAASGGSQKAASGDRVKPGAAPKMASSSQNMVIVGMPDRILKPEDMTQRLKTSYNTVLQWLEDLPVPETMMFQKIGDADHDSPNAMEARYPEKYQQDLAVVGHLHEIAEEHENLDEEESIDYSETAATSGNHLNDVSSFGKFLIRAAQRQPKQGLSRVQARATVLTAR